MLQEEKKPTSSSLNEEEIENKRSTHKDSLLEEKVPLDTAEVLEAKKLEEGNPKTKKNRKTLIGNLVLLAILTILVLALFLNLGEINSIGDTIKEIGSGSNWQYLIYAFMAALIYFLLFPITVVLFARASGMKDKFRNTYLVGSIEQFYNGVTPFATGGQPFQIYYFSRQGHSVDKATAAVLANFVTYMIATNLIAIVSLCFYPYIVEGLRELNMEWFQWVAVVGYIINFAVLLFMIALGTSKKIRELLMRLALFLIKPKFMNKHFAKFIPSLESYMENAQIGFKSIWKHRKTFVFSLLIKLVTMMIYYSIPYFLIRSVGINPTNGDVLNFIIVTFAASYAITSVVWVPTPGGTGGIEWAFSVVVASVCTLSSSEMSQSLAISLLWRLVTYYFILFISIASVLILHISVSRKKKQVVNDDR